MSNLIIPQIKNALSSHFVKWEKLAEIMSLAYIMKKPILLYGRGGHGKSEMVRSVFKVLAECQKSIFVQSFGEGMTEAKLYGGLDLKALNCAENPRMQYRPEDSFLSKEFVLFEELFDAPPVVLLALKDTLTDRCLNNGAQTYPMRTKLLVAATNKNPAEISGLGDSAHALTERFPLQLCVEWDSYESSDFEELFNKVTPNRNYGIIPGSSIRGTLAGLIAEAHENGEWISPRQAIVCMDLIVASATIRGSHTVDEEDLFVIQHIPGTAGIMEDMHEKVAHAREVAAASESLNFYKEEYKDLSDALQEVNTPIPCLKLVKKIQELESVLYELRVPDALCEKRNNLGTKITNLVNKARDKALDCVY